MDFLIVANAPDTQAITQALASEPSLRANIKTASLVKLAHRHLLYDTPDMVVVIGEHDPHTLTRFSDLVNVMGCDQILADSLLSDFVVIRRCDARPYSEPRHAGVTVERIVADMAAKNGVRRRGLASGQKPCAVPA